MIPSPNSCMTSFAGTWTLLPLPIAFPKEEDRKEIFMGDVIREAIGSELKIDQIMFPQGTYIDIGSPEDMVAAIRTHADRSTHTKGHGKNT
jgi:dTDP-glucose pyrophosphorylase